MIENYHKYLLEGNPFPEAATLDPNSPDRKTNGQIFCEEIVRYKLKATTEKIEGKVNVVYVAGLEFDKGLGKSALVVHQWRGLKERDLITAPYMRCRSRQKPADFCDTLVKAWSDQHHVWRAFGNIVSKFASEQSSPSLTKQSVELLLKTYPNPPVNLPFVRYLHVTRPETLAKSLGDWIHAKDPQLQSKYGRFFVEQNLTHPAEFFDNYLRMKIPGMDRIDLYKNTMLCLNLGGYQYHYLFLDQFEDAVMPVSPNGMADFCLGMRRIIEANQDLAMMIVTLHPDSETKLDLPAAADLVRIAPTDNYHRVDMLALEAEGDDAIALATAYLDSYRLGKPPYRTFPLEEGVIRYAGFLEGGNIRRTLQRLNVCLRVAASRSAPEVTMDYVAANHRELMGTEPQSELLTKFNASAKSQNKA